MGGPPSSGGPPPPAPVSLEELVERESRVGILIPISSDRRWQTPFTVARLARIARGDEFVFGHTDWRPIPINDAGTNAVRRQREGPSPHAREASPLSGRKPANFTPGLTVRSATRTAVTTPGGGGDAAATSVRERTVSVPDLPLLDVVAEAELLPMVTSVAGVEALLVPTEASPPQVATDDAGETPEADDVTASVVHPMEAETSTDTIGMVGLRHIPDAPLPEVAVAPAELLSDATEAVPRSEAALRPEAAVRRGASARPEASARAEAVVRPTPLELPRLGVAAEPVPLGMDRPDEDTGSGPWALPVSDPGVTTSVGPATTPPKLGVVPATTPTDDEARLSVRVVSSPDEVAATSFAAEGDLEGNRVADSEELSVTVDAAVEGPVENVGTVREARSGPAETPPLERPVPEIAQENSTTAAVRLAPAAAALAACATTAERLDRVGSVASTLRRLRDFVAPLDDVLAGRPARILTSLGDELTMSDVTAWVDTFAGAWVDTLCSFLADAARSGEAEGPGVLAVRDLLRDVQRSVLAPLADAHGVELVLILTPVPFDSSRMRALGRLGDAVELVRAQRSCGLVVRRKVVRPAGVLVG